MVQRYAKLIQEDLKERHARCSPLAVLVPKAEDEEDKAR